MEITSLKKSSEKDTLVLLVEKGNHEKALAQCSASEKELIEAAVKREASFAACPGEVRLLVVEFLAPNEDLNKQSEATRKAGAERLGLLKSYKVSKVVVKNLCDQPQAYQYGEGMALANYQFLKYFKAPKDKVSPLKEISFPEETLSKEDVKTLGILVRATNKARDLVNEPVSYLTAEQLSSEIEDMGHEAGFKVEVFNKKKIEKLKMGGLLAVNRGSQQPPTFNILEYSPAKAVNSRPIVLVGKGVVFDTGGLSLKPTPNSMDAMKCDMAGAATVACAIYAIALAKLPFHVVGLIPATDNRPGEIAYVPGDVVKMFSGDYVEVLNTDAEGRMILADALHYAKNYDPEMVFDFATLTGAAVAAFGFQACPIMGNADEETKNMVRKAGFATHERVVEMPLWDEYKELIKSDIADLKNIGGPYGGSITAGKFLEHFTNYPWLHFDIAGPAFLNGADSYRPKGGTGFGVRMLFEYFKLKAEA